jgi:hypothetical protein
MAHDDCFLILGGAGLVGKQIAYRIAHDLKPEKVVIASLWQQEVDEALSELREIFAGAPIEWVGEWGNIFVREELSAQNRTAMLSDPDRRDMLYVDLFGSIETAHSASLMVHMIHKHRPNVIVDSINTATAISYQDIDTASAIAHRSLIHMSENAQPEEWDQFRSDMEMLILSQSLPQLVRHVQMLHRAMREVGTRLYLKIGTTGTGGMGLNIPYTHSEDRPSARLMTKTAVAFAHTGLMFLMARTPNGPIVKEIKPGAMIGYKDVACRPISERGQRTMIYTSRVEALDSTLTLRESPDQYTIRGELALPVADTGENGLFTRGEFEAITALRQMEFITPEEIAREAALEILGSNTGKDVIAAIDASVMNPTYRAGYLRTQVLAELKQLEEETNSHSVALGQLGPPELSKLLWEAELLRMVYATLSNVLKDEAAIVSRKLYALVQNNAEMTCSITSIGLPILVPDGKHLIRGPRIRIPEIPGENTVELTSESVDQWAAKGWLDLRSENMESWRSRFERMISSQSAFRGRGSSAITRDAYLFDDIRIGEIVGWMFNNDQEGYRIK